MTTLREAAEALLKAAEKTATGFETNLQTCRTRHFTMFEVDGELIDALRAALAAEDAWRARAEAAIAVMEARRAMVIAKQVWLYPDPDDDKAAMRLDYDSKRDAYIAARRRYEETCRG